jgi:transposase
MTNLQFRIETVEEYLEGRITAPQASGRLGLHRVTFWRLVKKYEANGRRGLDHGLKGKRSNHAKPESLKMLVCDWYERHYAPSGRSVRSFYRDVRLSLPEDLSYATVVSWIRPKVHSTIHTLREKETEPVIPGNVPEISPDT